MLCGRHFWREMKMKQRKTGGVNTKTLSSLENQNVCERHSQRAMMAFVFFLEVKNLFLENTFLVGFREAGVRTVNKVESLPLTT